MRKITKTAMPTLLAVMAMASLAMASLALGAEEDPGLAVGKKAPKIELKDQSGEVVKVADLLKEGPVAVVFYRSADW